MYKRIMVFLLAALVMASGAQAAGNEWNDSFSKAKKTLERQVYYDHRITLYCGAAFDEKKNVTLPEGFTAAKHGKRAGKVEWEHVVPAENFGQAFAEWREGDAQCVDNRGKAFKGRKCAEKASREYRLMQADLYNLYPAVGAVNALRQNYNFQMLPGVLRSLHEHTHFRGDRVARASSSWLAVYRSLSTMGLFERRPLGKMAVTGMLTLPMARSSACASGSGRVRSTLMRRSP